MEFANYWFSSGSTGGEIGDSLRFRGNQFLRRTNTGGQSTSETFSFWVKLSNPGTFAAIISRVIQSGVTELYVGHKDDELQRYNGYNNAGTAAGHKHRDSAAWYHVVVATDGTGTTHYINGIQAGSNNDAMTLFVNNTAITIGGFTSIAGSNLNGYLNDIHGIDGQKLNADHFGKRVNGIWVPKAYTGAYGNNGFHLTFDPSQNADPVVGIGIDSSGNDNHFTASGFEVGNTGSTNYDAMDDSPLSNYATLNPLGPLFFTASVGGSGDNRDGALTEAVNSTGSIGCYVEGSYLHIPANNTKQYYLEAIPLSGWTPNTGNNFGISFIEAKLFNSGQLPANYFPGSNGVPGQTAWSNGVSVSNGTVVNGAFPAISGFNEAFQVWIKGRDIVVNTSGNLSAGQATTFTLPVGQETVLCFSGYQNHTMAINYGQRPFKHGPPAGTSPVNYQTQELPAAPIPNGRDHFQAITDTGANIRTAAQTAFPEGLWWIKDRVNARAHQLVDSLRGKTTALYTPNQADEAAYANPAGNSVAWCWSAPEVFDPSPNSTGMTAVAGRRNVAAGFSMMTYTPGVYNSGSMAVGHGLSQRPELCMIQNRALPITAGKDQNWITWHKDSITVNPFTATNVSWFDTTGGSLALNVNYSKFNYFADGQTVGSGENYVMYCWHSVPGYSKIGSYRGNGSLDGVYIHLGFRPAWFMVKRIDAQGNWVIQDSTRSPHNQVDNALTADNIHAEHINFGHGCDFLSNGVKIRSNGVGFNQGQYVYFAMAEHPFGGSNVSPANAR